MKTRLQKLILSLLIAVLCVNCALPAFAAEGMTEREKQYFEKGLKDSKDAFFALYNKLWEEHKLDKTLIEVIDNAINDKMEKMTPGTKTVQILARSKVGEEIQGTVIEKFYPHYQKFIKDLERRFDDENIGHVSRFYNNISDAAISDYDDPVTKAYISKSTQKITEGSARTLQKQIAVTLKKNKYDGIFQAGTIIIAIASKLFNKKISAFVVQKVGVTAIGKALGAKVVEAAVPIAGYIIFAMAAWDVYKLAKALLYARAELTEQLYKGMSKSFKEQQPTDYWELMEKDVRAIYEGAYETFKKNLNDAKNFANDPKVKASMEND